VYLARVIGRVVATHAYPGTEGVALQWVQPLDENGDAMGDSLVACAVVSTGPGDLVHFVDGREAALACPETFVPVDAAIIGFVEQAYVNGRHIGGEPVPAGGSGREPDGPRDAAGTGRNSSGAARGSAADRSKTNGGAR
jgi:microcompartment protein CcmK/EutM